MHGRKIKDQTAGNVGLENMRLENAGLKKERPYCTGCKIKDHTHNHFTAVLEYVRDHPGEQVPERQNQEG